MITDRTLLAKNLAELRLYRETWAREIRDYGYKPECNIFAHFDALTSQPDFLPPLSCEAITASLVIFLKLDAGQYAILSWLMASTACQCLAEDLHDTSSDAGDPPWDEDLLSQQLWLMRLRRLAASRERVQVCRRDDTDDQAAEREAAVAKMWEQLRLLDYLRVVFRVYKMPVSLESVEARAKALVAAPDNIVTAPAPASRTRALTPSLSRET